MVLILHFPHLKVLNLEDGGGTLFDEERRVSSQAAPLIVNQQNGAPLHSQAISLDLLKANGAPTLVTDSNGNHYLIALTSHGSDGQNGVSSLAKTGGRITLQVRALPWSSA